MLEDFNGLPQSYKLKCYRLAKQRNSHALSHQLVYQQLAHPYRQCRRRRGHAAGEFNDFGGRLHRCRVAIWSGAGSVLTYDSGGKPECGNRRAIGHIQRQLFL